MTRIKQKSPPGFDATILDELTIHFQFVDGNQWALVFEHPTSREMLVINIRLLDPRMQQKKSKWFCALPLDRRMVVLQNLLSSASLKKIEKRSDKYDDYRKATGKDEPKSETNSNALK